MKRKARHCDNEKCSIKLFLSRVKNILTIDCCQYSTFFNNKNISELWKTLSNLVSWILLEKGQINYWKGRPVFLSPTWHDVMTRKCFPHYWPSVMGIHWSPEVPSQRTSIAKLLSFLCRQLEPYKQKVELPIWDAMALTCNEKHNSLLYVTIPHMPIPFYHCILGCDLMVNLEQNTSYSLQDKLKWSYQICARLKSCFGHCPTCIQFDLALWTCRYIQCHRIDFAHLHTQKHYQVSLPGGCMKM